MTPSQQDFWFLPLGGCGEIGMNLNLFGHAGHWLMVDCGVTFEKFSGHRSGNRVEMPDPIFISNRQQDLAGIIATHAHEDHIGALPHLWEQFRCPIYTTPFTRLLIQRKFSEFKIDAPIICVHPGESRQIGPFEVEWQPITHSTPETNALMISCPAGRVVHTADWKIDPAPIVGAAFDRHRFEFLGQSGIDAVICDSTNAPQTGASVSESSLFEPLLQAVRESSGRVVVGCFASNIARLQTLGNVAKVSQRYLGLLGRSLHRMVACARSAGYLEENFNTVTNPDLGYLLPEEVLAITTGSQGEQGAALNRLAMDQHPDLSLGAGDHVIFSAKTIPGNESGVARLIEAFTDRGIRVTHAETAGEVLHASGHPCAEELRQMYSWLRPRLAIPVHGEPYHMDCNARLAEESGVSVCLRGSNGDLFDIVTGRLRPGFAPVGRLWFDEAGAELRRVETL